MEKALFLTVKKQKLNRKKKSALNKFKSKEHLFRLFLSLALMTSIVLSFISVIGIDCYIWPVLGVGAVFTALIWLEWGRKTSVYAVLFFVFGFILIGFVMKNQFAINSVLLLYNQVAFKVGALSIRNPLTYVVDVADSAYPLYFTYLMSMLAAFCGLISYMTVAHKQYFYVGVYVFGLALLLVFGFEVNPWITALFITVLILILIYNRTQKLTKSFLFVLSTIILSSVITMGIALLFKPVIYSCRSPFECISESVRFTNGNADNYGDGKISGLKMNKSADTALKITMEKPKPIYLKGFVGATFNGYKWSEPSEDISYTEGELFYLLHKNSFYNYSSVSKLYDLANPDCIKNTIEIEYVNADNKYVYLPYEVSNVLTDNVLEINGDYCKRISSEINSYTVSISELSYQKLLDFKNDNKDKLSGETYDNYSLCEENYSEFVFRYYSEVNEQEKTVITKVFDEYEISINQDEEKDYDKIIEQVRKVINSELKYDESVKVPAIESNSAEYLLNKANAGFDKHYATLATLMFRVMGVPARYVEGYIIPVNEAVKIKSNTPYSIKGTNAHAWTEIYVNGTGWVPVEICEEYYNNMFPDVEQLGIENDVISAD